jgi:hypothetical protein
VSITQVYETTILDTSGQFGFACMVIPSHATSVRLGEDRESSQGLVAELLGLSVDSPSPPSLDLATMLAILIAREQGDETYENYIRFSEYVSYARVIPFEQSPLGAESLAAIAANAVKGGTVTIGTTIGFMAAGPTPLLLITVPAGIILCGAAVSFSKWIEENRSVIWSKLLGVRTSRSAKRVKVAKKVASSAHNTVVRADG